MILFVYGTLRYGFSLYHGTLGEAHAPFVGLARTAKTHVMTAHSYPYVWPSVAKGSEHPDLVEAHVLGELYRIDPIKDCRLLEDLDRIEGQYTRARISVTAWLADKPERKTGPTKRIPTRRGAESVFMYMGKEPLLRGDGDWPLPQSKYVDPRMGQKGRFFGVSSVPSGDFFAHRLPEEVTDDDKLSHGWKRCQVCGLILPTAAYKQGDGAYGLENTCAYCQNGH